MSETLKEKIERSIDLLRSNEPQDGYALAFSGGKDSVVIKQLAIEADVKFKPFYSVTTIDYPELVQYIKVFHKDVFWVHNPRGGFFKRLKERGFFPTRRCRWCCGEYKEQSLKEYDAKLIGVRAAESARRKKLWKDVVSDWNKPTRKFVCSIVNWEDEDVWEFIRLRKLPYCELYDKGYKRLGCLNCPMQTAKRRRAEMKRYPRFENAFIKTAELTWEKWHNHINKNGKPHISSRFKSGKQWYEWWCSDLGIEAYFQEDCKMELMFVGTDESEAV